MKNIFLLEKKFYLCRENFLTVFFNIIFIMRRIGIVRVNELRGVEMARPEMNFLVGAVSRNAPCDDSSGRTEEGGPCCGSEEGICYSSSYEEGKGQLCKYTGYVDDSCWIG